MIKPKDDIEIVRNLNRCLDLRKLQRLLNVDEWNRFIELLETHQIVFSGDPTGFHIKDGELDCWDCGV